jgi:hypothetical protein
MIAAIAGILVVVVMVGVAYGQMSGDIGGLQSDVQHLQQGQKDLSAQIDRRFDQQNARILDQLGAHQHDPDGGAVFYAP